MLVAAQVAEAFQERLTLVSGKALFSPAVNLPRNTRLSTFTGRKNA